MKFLRTSKPSPSTYDEFGYQNIWGGFHRNTDLRFYLNILRVMLKFENWHWAITRYGLHLMHDRWRHRRCDTTDFHHNVYCTLDPYGKKIEDDYQWSKTWWDDPRAVAAREARKSEVE